MRGFRKHLRAIAALLILGVVAFTCVMPVQAQVTLVGGGGASTGGTNDWTGTNNFTSTVSIYQTSTHTGNNHIDLSHNGTTGVVASGAGGVVISGDVGLGNSDAFLKSSTGDFQLGTASQLCWTSAGAGSGTCDTFVNRKSAAVVQFGKDLNGTAVSQTIKGPDGVTGSDVKGGAVILESGLGTGAAVTSPLTINRVVTKATGTTAQTYAPVYVPCPTKILSNTSATVQTVATITTTSTTGGNVTMDYTVVANNGTLQDVDGGVVKVGWNNNAGTVAAAMTAVVLQSDSDASGTLAATPTQSVATNVVSIKLAPTWTVIVPTSVTALVTFTLGTTGDTVVCQ